jgi:transcriptional regulator with GAF, ATPase, and Fis domain
MEGPMMPEEARDFEVLRAELDARMHELVDETGENVATAGTEVDKAPGEAAPSAGIIRTAMPRPREIAEAGEFLTLEEVERRHIVKVLEARGWRVSGPKGAARVLGLNPSTLRSRMKKLAISRDISR